MKVPIRYKSSDRYNAGVDVVYDDESKLQYAPFVYATTASGDNGGGEDEEGEDSMVVNANATETGLELDKTWQEIYDAVETGKSVYLRQTGSSDETALTYIILHIDMVGANIGSESSTYFVKAHVVSKDLSNNPNITILEFATNNTSGYPFVSYVPGSELNE